MSLLGVTIHEPDVALTDVGLAFLGGYLGWRLWTGPEPGMLERHGAIIMAGLASAAFWGAIFHGFFPAHTATPPGFVIWMLVALSIVVVAATLIDLGLRILVPGLPPPLRNAIVGIYAVSFAAVVVLVDESFTSIVRFYGPALVLVLIAAAGQAVRGGSAGWRLIAIGFAVSIGAALLAAGSRRTRSGVLQPQRGVPRAAGYRAGAALPRVPASATRRRGVTRLNSQPATESVVDTGFSGYRSTRGQVAGQANVG